jgi:hypothetical protein
MSTEPLPIDVPCTLTTEAFSLSYAQGEIRNLKAANKTLVQRIYVAVRDRNWGTVPADIELVTKEISPKAFLIAVKAIHKQNDIHFVWNGTIIGRDDALTFDFFGTALSTFYKNRIGFCLLIPADIAGTLCHIEHTDGTTATTSLPLSIIAEQPVPPFANLKALTLIPNEHLRYRIELDGDIFEMEDQRNWTDASYKIYSTPLGLPFPVRVTEGTTFRQRITVRIEKTSLSPAHFTVTSSLLPRLDFALNRSLPIPPVGFGVPSTPPRNVERLKLITPAHLRCELHLDTPNWPQTLEVAGLWASALARPLELALLFSENQRAQLSLLKNRLEASPLPIARWLVLPATESPQQAPPYSFLLNAHREHFASTAPVGTGTNSDFLFINRFRPPMDRADFLAFSINPQVHAFDDLSLIENLTPQRSVVENARRIAEGRPVSVGPVTLRPRSNPYATSTTPQPIPADPRQQTLIGAVWTLGSLAYLIEAQSDFLTFYELWGSRGLLQEDRVFPLYHLFADLAEFQGGVFHPSTSTHPNEVLGFAVENTSKMAFFIANLTAQPQQVALPALNGSLSVRTLDESTLSEATWTPEIFRSTFQERTFSEGEPFLLSSYAYVRLDLAKGVF